MEAYFYTADRLKGDAREEWILGKGRPIAVVERSVDATHETKLAVAYEWKDVFNQDFRI